MPKQKVGIVIATFEGQAIDWGVITERGLTCISGQKKASPHHPTVLDNTMSPLWPPCPGIGPPYTHATVSEMEVR